MGFYESIRDGVAGPLIEKYGTSMILRRTVKGAYDPNTGTMAADTVTDHPCKGLFQDFTQQASKFFYGSGVLTDTLVKKDDELVLLSAKGLSIAPESVTDTLVVGSITYQIVKAKPLCPALINIMFNIQVRI